MKSSGWGIRGSGLGSTLEATRRAAPTGGRPRRCGGSALHGGLRFALAILAISAVQACATKSTPKATGFFPDTNEISGWSMTAATRTFEASRLWEYIDGDAEKYIQAGVAKTLTTDYRYRDKVEATADVYVMKASEGARKIFDSESAVGSKPVQIGEAGRLSRASLTFYKGRYFVRLVAYEEAPDVGDALMALGKGIEKRLGVGG